MDYPQLNTVSMHIEHANDVYEFGDFNIVQNIHDEIPCKRRAFDKNPRI